MFEHRAGVYRITCTLNNKSYIGSTGDIQKRVWTHQSALRTGRHANARMQSDWDMYGPQGFAFHALEYIDGTKPQRLVREQYYLDTLHPEYNVAAYAEDNRGVKMPRDAVEATRAKITGLKRTDETKEAIGNFHRGRKRSGATITKMKVAKRQMSDETKAKMAESARKRVERLGPPLKASQAGADATRDKPRSEATKNKISQTKRQRFASGQPLPNTKRDGRGQFTT